jgi:DNA polymerase IV
MTAAERILHADLDSFYASVEQRDDPRLRGGTVGKTVCEVRPN